MDIIAQQQWFTKILWMAFGVNADEMGFTETSNRAVGEEQIKVFKRKAIKPILQVIQYHINTQIMPEFFSEPMNGVVQPAPDFSDVPLEFVFDIYDIDEDIKELNKLQMEANLGIKTTEMIAKERGISIEELNNSKEMEYQKQLMRFQQSQMMQNQGQQSETSTEESNQEQSAEEDTKENVEEKAISPVGEIEDYIDQLGKTIVNSLENLNEHEIKTGF